MIPLESEIVIACSDCAAGIANDDWTHLALDEDPEVEGSVVAFLEAGELQHITIAEGRTGFAALVHGHTYFRCACCGCDALGGEAFTRSTV